MVPNCVEMGKNILRDYEFLDSMHVPVSDCKVSSHDKKTQIVTFTLDAKSRTTWPKTCPSKWKQSLLCVRESFALNGALATLMDMHIPMVQGGVYLAFGEWLQPRSEYELHFLRPTKDRPALQKLTPQATHWFILLRRGGTRAQWYSLDLAVAEFGPQFCWGDHSPKQVRVSFKDSQVYDWASKTPLWKLHAFRGEKGVLLPVKSFRKQYVDPPLIDKDDPNYAENESDRMLLKRLISIWSKLHAQPDNDKAK